MALDRHQCGNDSSDGDRGTKIEYKRVRDNKNPIRS